jgi:mannose-6-phosphate isomerase-like protein (cupin superfamily)
MQIPPRCVTVLAPGVRANFSTEDRALEQLVLRVPSALPPLPDAAKAFLKTRNVCYALDNVEAHDSILERPDLGVRVLPKYTVDGSKVRGWACNLHKGEPIGIDAGAEWMAVRSAEEYHYHEHTNEMYVILDGVGRFCIGGEMIDVPRGSLLSCSPYVAHKVESVEPGVSGLYAHITFQYPQIPPEAKDKVVVPE